MVEKFKILYVVTRCMKSGPIQVLNNIVDNLNKDIFELYLVSISDESTNRSILKEMKNKFQYMYIPINKLNAVFGRCDALKKYIEEINPDVIHSTGVIPDYIINKYYSDKQIIIAHSNDKIDFSMRYGKLMGFALATWHIRIMKKANTVIACSKSLSDIYMNKESLYMGYIRNGIFYKQYENICITEYKEKCNFSLDVKTFIYTASFNKRKNHEFLLDSFVKLHDEGYDYNIVLLGDGPTFQTVYNKYSKYLFVDFRGRVSDVDTYLNAADYYISTSKQEGMPMSVLEAMNCGLPYVLSDIKQHQEIYDIDNDAGELYRENDYESFKLSIQRVLKYDKVCRGKKINSIVLNNFNAENMGKAYEEVYEKIGIRK